MTSDIVVESTVYLRSIILKQHDFFRSFINVNVSIFIFVMQLIVIHILVIVLYHCKTINKIIMIR